MTGHKWEVTRHATVDFIRYLDSTDVVSAIVFNDNPHLVMHWGTRQNQLRMGQMGVVQPFSQIMTNEAYFDPNEFNPQFRGNNAGYYPNNGIRQPLNGATYIIEDPYYSNNNGFCCC